MQSDKLQFYTLHNFVARTILHFTWFYTLHNFALCIILYLVKFCKEPTRSTGPMGPPDPWGSTDPQWSQVGMAMRMRECAVHADYAQRICGWKCHPHYPWIISYKKMAIFGPKMGQSGPVFNPECQKYIFFYYLMQLMRIWCTSMRISKYMPMAIPYFTRPIPWQAILATNKFGLCAFSRPCTNSLWHHVM